MEDLGSQKAKVKLTGLTGILFDRFIDMSEQGHPPEQKLYLASGNQVVLPSENLYSFLFSANPPGCAQWFEAQKGKQYSKLGMSYVGISPEMIPFTREGKPIKFTGFKDGYDAKADIRVLYHKAKVKKSGLMVPAPKERPVLNTPWELEFGLEIFTNHLITMDKMQAWFSQGGIEVAIGAFRPRFGRFLAEFVYL